MQSEHSSLGASGAKRWMSCPGSVALIETLPPEMLGGSTEFAEEGTLAHEAAAYCLIEGKETWEAAAKFPKLSEENWLALEKYLGYVHSVESKAVAARYVEAKFQHPSIHPKFYGTIDYGAYAPNGDHLIEVVDLKFGVGLYVDARDNPQIRYYAVGMLAEVMKTQSSHTLPQPDLSDLIAHFSAYEHAKVKLTIVQPRAGSEGSITHEVLTVQELLSWARDQLLPAMAKADSRTMSFNAGDHCQFCPARAICPLLEGLAQQALSLPGDVSGLTNEALFRKFEGLDNLRKYIKGVESEMESRVIRRGLKIEGVQVVEGRANRDFKPGAQEALFAALGEAIYTQPELKSPAQIEKLNETAKKLVKEWAVKPPGRMSVSLIGEKGIVGETVGNFTLGGQYATQIMEN